VISCFDLIHCFTDTFLFFSCHRSDGQQHSGNLLDSFVFLTFSAFQLSLRFVYYFIFFLVVTPPATNSNIVSFELSQSRASNFASEVHYAFKGLGVNFPILLFDASGRGKFRADLLIPPKELEAHKAAHVKQISRKLLRLCLMKVDGSIVHETGKEIII
jgi:hypothetical protein